MNIHEILEQLKEGKISVHEAEKKIKLLAIEQVENIAKIDIGRETRKGVPEIILAEGKKDKEILEIAKTTTHSIGRAIISRLKEEQIRELEKLSKEEGLKIKIYEKAKIVTLSTEDFKKEMNGGRVGILTGGTSDIPIAEEVIAIAEEMGCETYYMYDVGVAGIQRVFDAVKYMIERDIDVLVVVAGREGTLPTIVASLIDVPIIAVPTSIGYGHGGKGKSALLT
ncbi:MAG: nickel pincer cofactor biosynthesis protein LarB, partial [Thermoproteota archaeon]